MPGRASPKRQRAPRLDPQTRRPLILDAALRVYLRDGYDGASMDAIAQEAAVTKPVLYDSFAGKRELFAALFERERQGIIRAVADALPADVQPARPEEALSHGLRAYFRAVRARPDSFRVTLHPPGRLSPEASATIAQTRALITTQIAALIEQWLRSVEARDPQRIAAISGHALVGAAENLALLLLDEPERWDPDEIADVLTTLLTTGARSFTG